MELKRIMPLVEIPLIEIPLIEIPLIEKPLIELVEGVFREGEFVV